MGATAARKTAERAVRKTPERAMRSQVNWALLGLVIDRPSYGLELAHRFQRLYADTLRLSSESHIYTALDALERRGLIAEVPSTGRGRQPKPHYQATQLGVRSYEEWVVAQVDEERRRQELWVRQLGIFAHNPVVALHMIGRFEREYLKGAGQTGRSPQGSASDVLVDELVAEDQRNAVGARLSWLSYARERFEALAGESPSNGPS